MHVVYVHARREITRWGKKWPIYDDLWVIRQSTVIIHKNFLDAKSATHLAIIVGRDNQNPKNGNTPGIYIYISEGARMIVFCRHLARKHQIYGLRKWKTNRSAVIARRRFRRKNKLFFNFLPFSITRFARLLPVRRLGGSLKPSDLKTEKRGARKLFFSKSSCDHNAPVSFPFSDPFLVR